VRGTEILFRRPSVALVLLLGSTIGCRSEESATGPQVEREAARPESSVEPDRELDDPQAAPEPTTVPEPNADDSERADKLADLDALCKALDHDYIDGTLSDYYRGIEPRTAWGKAQRDAGNLSIQPGRLLEKAVAELSPGAKDPELEHCRKLLDYLDDVE
jgi:hypothetical protein